MQLFQLQNVTVNLAGRELYRGLNWSLNTGEHLAVLGTNGAGKSTLFKLLLGEIEASGGQLQMRPRLRLGYLPQDVELPAGKSLLETALIKPPALAQVERALTTIEAQLAEPDVYKDAQRLTQVLTQHEAQLARFEAMNGHRYANHARELLALLGFREADYSLPNEALSGGQKKLLALVQLAVAAPDILLLDEPDNHLDLAGKHQLERFIHSYRQAVVVISHDRSLLDAVANKTVELEAGKLTVYHGNYSFYRNQRELQRLRQQQQYVTQQKEIARIEAMIEQFERWAKQVLSRKYMLAARQRRRMLEKMEQRGDIIERVSDARLMQFKVDGWRGSNKVLELDSLSLAFDGKPLLQDLHLLLRHGERVGLIGANGAGKTVLLRVILGEIAPHAGRVKRGPSVRIGYYSQEHQTLDAWLDRSPLALIRHAQNSSDNAAVNFLLRMSFSYEQASQPIRSLSGGERSRLQLALIMLRQPNLLLLDEPTNNLDIPSVEVLEQALDDFIGTVLIVSHDRYFLDETVDRILELDGGRLREFPGGYSEYLAATGRL